DRIDGVFNDSSKQLQSISTCNCNVTCTTDYISSLNCSCTGPELTSSYHLEAQCNDEGDDEVIISVSCNIASPQRWCTLELDPDELPIGADTKCTVLAKHSNLEQDHSADVKLYENIKLQPPFNISLTESNGSYTVSWEMAYTDGSYLNNYLIYRVRFRIKGGTKQDHQPVYEDRRYLEIPRSYLKKGKEYIVDVQARVNPSRISAGFWSEWTPAEVRSGEDDMRYCLLLLIMVPCVLCIFGGRLWLRKVHVYIPSPEGFFKPLYNACDGDFKIWAGTAFTFNESDFQERNMVSENQVKSLKRLCEGEEEANASMTSLGGSSIPFLASHSTSKQSTQGGSCSQDPDSSVGHISIDTVTVLGEESPSSGGLRGSFRDSHGNCFTYPHFIPGGSTASEHVSLLGLVSGGAEGYRGSPTRLVLDGELCLLNEGNEPDQSSLESFSFTERSEDGYPRVMLDMDTIDSGFLDSECSSPIHSDLDVKEQMDAAVLAEAQRSHSNYVKQWVATTGPSGHQVDSRS
ncbi:hypothetical protein JZ751_026215, partial [Albula glossodonta]